MKSKKDIENLICEALKENNINTNSINPTTIDKIEEEYQRLYNMLVPNNEEKELDTFNDATCIVKAINKHKIIKSDNNINAKIAVDIAFSMCENPIWYVGSNYNIQVNLEPINTKEIYQNQEHILNELKNNLIDIIVNNRNLKIEFSLEYFYRYTLTIKRQNQNNNKIEKDNSTLENDVDAVKVKSKLFGRKTKK